MKKSKTYSEVRFNADVLKEAFASAHDLAKRHQSELHQLVYAVEQEDATWHYDNLEEFLSDYRKSNGYACLSCFGAKVEVQIRAWKRHSEIEVKAPLRSEIELIFDNFERNVAVCRLAPLPVEPASKSPITFVGHGRSTQWRELKDHLRDKHNVTVEAYETGARAGHTIRDILEEMVSKSSFAVLVLTGEDEQADGTLRARQNVVHEAGLFQGRLGFARAVMLIEEGVDDFSNIHGIQYIRFAKCNIKETFGEVVATLRREFHD